MIADGAVVDDADPDGWTALHWAVVGDRLEVVQMLLDRGADPNAQDALGLTPLHWAAMTGHIGLIAPLLRRGARVDARSGYGTTPLHEAANPRVVAVLIDAGADIEAVDDRGNTPLHVARNGDVARALLDRKADIRKRRNDGATALEVVILRDLERVGVLFHVARAAERLRSAKSRFTVTARNVSACPIDDFVLVVQSPAAWALVGPRKIARLAPGQRATVGIELTRKPDVGDGRFPIDVTVASRGKTLGRFALEVDTTQGEIPADRGMIKLGKGALRPTGSSYARYLPLLAVPVLVLGLWWLRRRRR